MNVAMRLNVQAQTIDPVQIKTQDNSLGSSFQQLFSNIQENLNQGEEKTLQSEELLNSMNINEIIAMIQKEITEHGLEQISFETIVNFSQTSVDELFESIKEIVGKMINKIEADSDLAGNLESQNLLEQLKLLDEDIQNRKTNHLLNEQLFMSFIQLFNQVESTSLIKTDDNKDLTEIIKTAFFLEQFTKKSELPNLPMTDEQLETMDTFLNRLSSSQLKNEILQNAFMKMNAGELKETFPLPFKQVHFLKIESSMNEKIATHQTDPFIEKEMIERPFFLKVVEGKDSDQKNLGFDSSKNPAAASLTNDKTIQRPTFQLSEDEILNNDNEANVQEEKLNSSQVIDGKVDLHGVVFGGRNSQQVITKLETFNLLNNDHKPITYEKFVKDFQSILARSSFSKNGNMQRLVIKLYPEELGSIRIELVQRQNELVARILSSTQKAKELLDSQIHGLRQAFTQQNLNVTRIDIENQWQEQDAHDENGAKQQQSESQEKEQDKQKEEKHDSFSVTFHDTLLNYEV